MAAKKWMVLPGGRPKRWKATRTCNFQCQAPKWVRKLLNQKRRAEAKSRLVQGKPDKIRRQRKDAGWYYWMLW